ncbi:MAG: U32 family peptidase [Eubacterium sp.]|nr:U32 family peptidase [Eubacterium sp.]
MKPANLKDTYANQADKPELLAPAGSIEALKAAFIAGADAVYIGGNRFGARAYADNPDESALCSAIDLSHRLGKKLYMTVNTLVKNSEIEHDLETFMAPYVREGLDGVIVQDFGIVDLFQQVFPELPLHASTQMSITGVHGARFLKEIGMSRIVPARELSLEEIRSIHDQTGLEIESFIHGAMCYSYSGQCLMSSLIGGRSGNRGRCAGVCRLPFDVYEQGRLLTRPDTRYPLNMKDMNTVEILPDMIRAGISSFKIEGRMKKPEYTAGVVSVYRKYIDRYFQDPSRYLVDPEDLKFLWDLFNRDGFSKGCYFERNGRDMIALKNEKTLDVRQKAAASLTEQIRKELNTKEAGRKLQSPVAGRLILSQAGGAVLDLFWAEDQQPGSEIDRFEDNCPGEFSTERDRDTHTSCTHTSVIHVHMERDGIQKAKNQPVTEERVRAQMNKTGTSDFFFQRLDISMEDQLFVPMQLLNELRRDGFEALSQKIRLHTQRNVVPECSMASALAKSLISPAVEPDADSAPPASGDMPSRPAEVPDTEYTASVNTFAQLASLEKVDGLSAIWLDAEMFLKKNCPLSLADALRNIHQCQKDAFLMLPYLMRRDAETRLTSLIRTYTTAFQEEFPGRKPAILTRNLEELGLLRDMGLVSATILDAGIYTMNNRAELFFARNGYPRNTASLELNEQELRHRDNSQSECIVYGRAPMMLSAHCLKKTMDRCSHCDARLVLRDRKNAAFPAECHCTFCYNIIYNSLPTSLLKEHIADRPDTLSALDRLHFRSFRLQFTDESGELARDIAKAFLDRRDIPDLKTTRGHFRRGVE